MYLARIVCCDGDCVEEREVAIEALDELDRLSCPCGFGFVLLSVAELRKAA